jgi:hypothetical protein
MTVAACGQRAEAAAVVDRAQAAANCVCTFPLVSARPTDTLRGVGGWPGGLGSQKDWSLS